MKKFAASIFILCLPFAAAAAEDVEKILRDFDERLGRLEALVVELAADRNEDRQTIVNHGEESSAQMTNSYTDMIIKKISDNWILTPTSRNGALATIRIALVPSGHIVQAASEQSSGDPRFDQSALDAVKRSGPFLELRNLPIDAFEENYRNFYLSFTPSERGVLIRYYNVKTLPGR